MHGSHPTLIWTILRIVHLHLERHHEHQPKSTHGGDRGGGGPTKHDALHGQPRTRRSPQPRTPLVFESTRACTDKAEGTTHASVAAASHTPGVCAAGPSRRGHTPAGGNAHPSGAARLRPLALRRPRSGRPHARPHPYASHSHATPCQDCPATHAHTLCRHGTHCVRLRHPLIPRPIQSHLLPLAPTCSHFLHGRSRGLQTSPQASGSDTGSPWARVNRRFHIWIVTCAPAHLRTCPRTRAHAAVHATSAL